MNPERQQFLSLKVIPGRLTIDEAAWFLGFQPADLAVLIRVKLLKPLGDPSPNAPKFFCGSELGELVRNRSWLDKASRAISRYHRARNQKLPTQQISLGSTRGASDCHVIASNSRPDFGNDPADLSS